jgi:hypothetical protein
MRKKPDPLKTSILQPLWGARYISLEGCKIEVFNGPIFKDNSKVTMSIMIKEH